MLAERHNLCDPNFDIDGWRFDCADRADGVTVLPCVGAVTIVQCGEPALVIRCTCLCHAEFRGLYAARLHVLYFSDLQKLKRNYSLGILNEQSLTMPLSAAVTLTDRVPYGSVLAIRTSLN